MIVASPAFQLDQQVVLFVKLDSTLKIQLMEELEHVQHVLPTVSHAIQPSLVIPFATLAKWVTFSIQLSKLVLSVLLDVPTANMTKSTNVKNVVMDLNQSMTTVVLFPNAKSVLLTVKLVCQELVKNAEMVTD
jgi:hypothetical protein